MAYFLNNPACLFTELEINDMQTTKLMKAPGFMAAGGTIFFLQALTGANKLHILQMVAATAKPNKRVKSNTYLQPPHYLKSR